MTASDALGGNGEQKRFRRAINHFVCLVILAILGIITAYFQSFSIRRPFDDEGFLISWLRPFLEGRPLYAAVHCFYGPAYFAYQWGGHFFAGSRPTNDSLRFIAIFFRLTVSILAFGWIRRTTASLAAAAVSFYLVFRAAAFLGEEPGHPQELILLLAVGALAAAASRIAEAGRIALLLAISAVMILTKANAGLILLVAVGVSYASGLRPRWKNTVWLAAVVFPVLLFWQNLSASWAQRFLLVDVCAMAAVWTAVYGPVKLARFRSAFLVPAACGFMAPAALLVMFAAVRGAPLDAMAQWTLIKPRAAMGSYWYLPLEISGWALACAVAAAPLAWITRARPKWIGVLQLAAGAAVIVLAATGRYGALMALGPLAMWLVVLPGDIRLDAFARLFIAVFGVLFILYAYPVAGAHVRLADEVLILAGVLLVSGRLAAMPRVQMLVPAVVMILLAVIGLRARAQYLALMPLDLPGATRLRLPAEEVRGLRDVTAAVRANCDFLVTIPAMPSFQYWAGLPSLTGLPYASWMAGLSDAEQESIVRQISSTTRPCIVENPQMVSFWTHNADLRDRPVMRYARSNFRELMQAQGNHLLVPAVEPAGSGKAP